MDVQSTRTESAQAGQLIPQNTQQAGLNAGMIDLFAAALANSEQRSDTLDPDARRERRQARDPQDHDPADGYVESPRAPAPPPPHEKTRAAAEPQVQNAQNRDTPVKPQAADPASAPTRPTPPGTQRADQWAPNPTPRAATGTGAPSIDIDRSPTQMTQPRVTAPTSALTTQAATGPTAPALVSTDDLTAATARLTAPTALTSRGTGEVTGQTAGQTAGQTIGQAAGQTTSLAPGQTVGQPAGQANSATSTPVLADGQEANHDANTETRGAARAAGTTGTLPPTTGREIINDLPAATARLRSDAPGPRANTPGAVTQTTAN
ncbi:MAG: hypothetical protein ACPGVX_10930, partial [Thalassobaculaceae bacterium]